MKVVIKLFAGARELAGNPQVEVELAPGATVEVMRNALQEKYPTLAPLLPHALFAINTNYANDQTPVPENADVACIPPVSGG